MKISYEELKKIIKEEMEQKLDNESGDVAQIQREVHELWEKLSVFYTREAEQDFQEISREVERLQLPMNQQAQLKKKINDLKYELGEVIEKINRYKSFIEEVSNSTEEVDFSPSDNEVRDGYNISASDGGDYHET